MTETTDCGSTPGAALRLRLEVVLGDDSAGVAEAWTVKGVDLVRSKERHGCRRNGVRRSGEVHVPWALWVPGRERQREPRSSRADSHGPVACGVGGSPRWSVDVSHGRESGAPTTTLDCRVRGTSANRSTNT